MLITNDARNTLKEALREKECYAVQFQTKPSASGKMLGIRFVKEAADAERLNGVPVVIDDETKSWTKTLFIDAVGRKLKIMEMQNDACGGDCGSCGGCC